MQDSGVTAGSWVVIRNGCSMRYRFNRDEVEITFDDTTTFELAIEPSALGDLVRLGAEALAAAPPDLRVSPGPLVGR